MSNRSPDRARPQSGSPSAAGAARVARCTGAIRDISEDVTVLAETLLNSTHGILAPAAEMMQHIVTLQNLLEEATGVLVVRQRSQGKPLTDLAQILELTEDRLRRKYLPHEVDNALLTRRRPQRTPSTEPAPGAPITPNLLRDPRQRLATALTRMWRASGLRQYEIAHRMRVDDSYVSRMLSGQREASWQHVLAICEICDVDPDLMKPLWEAATGGRPTDTDPARHLRTYLQALHYAAGSPTPEAILTSAQHTITAAQLHQALNGPTVPAWSTVIELIVALQGLPETARTLWHRAQDSATTSN